MLSYFSSAWRATKFPDLIFFMETEFVTVIISVAFSTATVRLKKRCTMRLNWPSPPAARYMQHTRTIAHALKKNLDRSKCRRCGRRTVTSPPTTRTPPAANGPARWNRAVDRTWLSLWLTTATERRKRHCQLSCPTTTQFITLWAFTFQLSW